MKIGLPQTLVVCSVVLGYLNLYVAMWIFFSAGILSALMHSAWHVHEKTQELQQRNDHEKVLLNIVDQYNTVANMTAMSQTDTSSGFH